MKTCREYVHVCICAYRTAVRHTENDSLNIVTDVSRLERDSFIIHLEPMAPITCADNQTIIQLVVKDLHVLIYTCIYKDIYVYTGAIEEGTKGKLDIQVKSHVPNNRAP